MPTSSLAGSAAPKRSTVRKLPTPVQQHAADGEQLAQVVGYYARVLTESPEALEHLQRRRIAHPEALTTLGVSDGLCRDVGLDSGVSDLGREH